MFGARYFGNRHFGGRYFGHEGLTAPGYYNGHKYFARTYFGREYFGNEPDAEPFVSTVSAGLSIAPAVTLSSVTVSMSAPFDATVLTGLAMTGSGGLNATTSYVTGDLFVMGMPLSLETNATMSFTIGSIVIGYAPSIGVGRYFGGTYMGARYFGPSYWGVETQFESTVTTGLNASGSMTFAASASQVLEAAIQNQLAMSGVIGMGGVSISFDEPVTAPYPVAAGRSGRRRLKLEIDGKLIDVRSKEEALAVLERIKAEAEETAAQVVERAIKATRRRPSKILADARKALQPPEIEAPQYQDAVDAVMAEIADLYKQTLQTVEIEALMKKAQAEKEDEEVILAALL